MHKNTANDRSTFGTVYPLPTPPTGVVREEELVKRAPGSKIYLPQLCELFMHFPDKRH